MSSKLFLFIFQSVYLLSVDLSNRKVKRAVRTLQPLAAPLICIAIHILWLGEPMNADHVWIASLVLISLASFLNAIPNRFLKAAAKAVRRNRSPKTQNPLNKRGRSTAKTSTNSVPQQSAANLLNPTVQQSGSSAGSRPGSASTGQTQPSGMLARTRGRLSSRLLRASSLASATATE
ncbi:hypothetical protein PHET_00015 [Paragonimus heterotremus]|uniref:Uncharacterized protein n=1 Tax=Paragonimus heterotremus TaxID=100268 RepID=A0A8J4TTR1_9TREM|nr:hypothetical protein PHET_00015 [Paragonimus heterotremus]